VSPHRWERFAGADADPVDDVPAEDVSAEEIVREVEVVLGARLDPTLVEIVHHLPGIPQYGVGHVEWLEAIDEMLTRSPGLHIAGWSYRGVGVSQLAADAVRIAEKVTGR
jgi:oxygen-dependent protoporphyrinogen oxidase